jgi:murein L,D-transpeptidase YafK
MKRVRILILVIVAVALPAIFRHQIQDALTALLQRLSGRKTVAERLEQCGAHARERLRPFFEAKAVAYPPGKLVLVGLKSERLLEIYAPEDSHRFRLIRSYPILAASGTMGPKLREGDRQVPEGLYRIESLNPNSRYHLSLRLDYPNEFDREQAARDGRANLGGDIMIHGSSVSIGCLAMGDEAIEDIFVLAADTGIRNVFVVLAPVDFRAADSTLDAEDLPSWTDALYDSIRSELEKLPKESWRATAAHSSIATEGGSVNPEDSHGPEGTAQ